MSASTCMAGRRATLMSPLTHALLTQGRVAQSGRIFSLPTPTHRFQLGIARCGGTPFIQAWRGSAQGVGLHFYT
jgi:hypothetical protein